MRAQSFASGKYTPFSIGFAFEPILNSNWEKEMGVAQAAWSGVILAVLRIMRRKATCFQ